MDEEREKEFNELKDKVSDLEKKLCGTRITLQTLVEFSGSMIASIQGLYKIEDLKSKGQDGGATLKDDVKENAKAIVNEFFELMSKNITLTSEEEDTKGDLTGRVNDITKRMLNIQEE